MLGKVKRGAVDAKQKCQIVEAKENKKRWGDQAKKKYKMRAVQAKERGKQ